MLFAIAVAALVGSAASADSCSSKLEVSYPAPVAADGWSYRLVANGFTKPRGILFDSEGALLVVDSGVGLIHLALNDDGGTCLSVKKKTTLVESEDLNHGLEMFPNGTTVLASTSDKVFAWSYNATTVSVSDSNVTYVTNMSNSDHTTRTLLLPRNQPGTLLVSRGSDSNEDPDAEDVDSGHSQIRMYALGRRDDDDPYEFLDGELLSWGLRNSVGVGEDPVEGGIWAVENSVDEMTRNGIDIHENNPGEELNYLGRLAEDDPYMGLNYGYPLCYAVWSTDNFPDLGSLETGDQFPGAETSTLTDESCNANYTSPTLAFQAHTAPLDIKFNKDGSEAFIAFHGSWNREDPVGYRIASVAFSDGRPEAEHSSTDAAVDVLTNPDLSACPDDCFRPAGLAWDSEGRLFFTSDSTGEIFVLQRSESNSGGGDSDEGDADDEGVAVTLLSGKAVAWAMSLAAVVLGVLLA